MKMFMTSVLAIIAVSSSAFAAEASKTYNCMKSYQPGAIHSNAKIVVTANDATVTGVTLTRSFYYTDLFAYTRSTQDFVGDQVVMPDGKIVKAYMLDPNDPNYLVVDSQVTSYFGVDATVRQVKTGHVGYPYAIFESDFVPTTNRVALANSIDNLRYIKNSPIAVKIRYEENEASYKLSFFSKTGEGEHRDPEFFHCGKR